jgi:hypothetical protein
MLQQSNNPFSTIVPGSSHKFISFYTAIIALAWCHAYFEYSAYLSLIPRVLIWFVLLLVYALYEKLLLDAS